MKFIGDGDALEHIVDKREGMDDSHCSASECLFFSWRLTVSVYSKNKDVQSHTGAVQKMVRLKSPPARRDREQDGDENGFLGEQNYIQALGADSMGGECSIVSSGLFYCHQIVMTEVSHVTRLCR